jgi:hypothetical protein
LESGSEVLRDWRIPGLPLRQSGAIPPLCPDRGWLCDVSPGRLPSLHRLCGRRRAGFDRLLLRYCGAVRLPDDVHGGRLVIDLPQPASIANRRELLGSPGFREMSVSPCSGASDSVASSCRSRIDAPLRVAFPLTGQGRHAHRDDFAAQWLA